MPVSRAVHGLVRQPALECHLLALADLARFADRAELSGPEGAARAPRALVRRVGRLLLATVLARGFDALPSRLRTPDIALSLAPGGRPVAPGERAAGARAGITHDGGMLVVGFHPAGCAVDVEDTSAPLIAEVAGRFCTAAERASLPVGAAVRGVWTAKEAVAKYTGLGLRAGLRTITFDADPLVGWARARHPGTRRPPLCRVVTTARRHLAFAIGAGGRPGADLGSGADTAIDVHRWVPILEPAADGGVGSLRLARTGLASSGELAELAHAVAAAGVPVGPAAHPSPTSPRLC
ncbi:4'-phosphopantetheinyl transferase [Frankia sp. AiPs1]|uniref:4'-phosphopantetheinyl transferase family protein n=1 Tax=Frankia sp. AiPa1 TaxID=573492 RepID=UPI00202B0CF8|nr:4'-phosphopantetheinyl transferase superfamily protein [Frankia sp. AiPa1]MCL9760250.1 4'-phosphopantetheinyl transferase superfamily protein [Frankia sp. AiPa1]